MSDMPGTNQRALLQQSFVRLKEMQTRLEAAEQARREPIAIVGMGCRFPGGADTPEAYWQLLYEGRDGITEVPPERWDIDAFYDADASIPGKISTRWGGFLKGVDQFDASFFGISPREAASMDPQQRLLLEVSWEALEDAGYTAETLAGSKTGVFIGIHNQSGDYTLMQFGQPEQIGTYTGTGTAHDIVSARIAYLWDLRGPSITLNTACSSSLVAVHLACQQLRNREVDSAIAGGVNLLLAPQFLIAASKMHLLSPDGRCKTFDAQGDGIVMGDGCGVIILKRLSDALTDGDRILATICGSAINQDGHSAGLTAPNVLSQKAVILQALENARVQPAQINYVETHGTGTSLGDPIEVEALTSIVGQPRADGSTCVLGSVKTNIGHLAGAAGIASLIKAVLCLQNDKIPPNLHFKTLNPSITLENTPFVIPTGVQPWQRQSGGRYAGISAFGWGGTNAHLILTDPPVAVAPIPMQKQQEAAPTHLLVISACTQVSLQRLAQAYQGVLAEAEESTLRDICYTASLHRTHHEYRLCLIGQTHQNLHDGVNAFLKGEPHESIVSGKITSAPTTTVFAFSGQGAQWIGMGQQLFKREPIFRACIEQCDSLLRHYVSWSLMTELAADVKHSRLSESEVAQPALFSIQVALASLWRSWNIEPDILVGQSVGEIAAAHIAGVLSLEDGIRVAVHRGHISQQAHGLGKMLAAEVTPDEAEHLLEPYADRISIAAVNSPTSIIFAGEEQALLSIQHILQGQDVFCRMLDVDYASHSPQMEPYKDTLAQLLEGLRPRPATIPLVSTVTGEYLAGPEMDARYWARNIREPVRFVHAMSTITKNKDDHAITVIEISPFSGLIRAISQCLQEREHITTVLHSLRLKEKEEETTTILKSLGTLYTRGYRIDWNKLYPHREQCVALPRYPWDRQSYWIEAVKAQKRRQTQPALTAQAVDTIAHELLGQKLNMPTQDIIFESEFHVQTHALLNDHRLDDTVVVSGSTFLAMAFAGAHYFLKEGILQLNDIEILNSLVVPENADQHVMTLYTPTSGEQFIWKIFSQSSDASVADSQEWQLHVTGKLSQASMVQATFAGDVTQIRNRCGTMLTGDEFYQDFKRRGYNLGSSFQWIKQIWRCPGEALCQLHMPSMIKSTSSALHPGLLDACMQTLWLCIPERYLPDASQRKELYVPVHIEQVYQYNAEIPSKSLWCHAYLHEDSSFDQGMCSGDITFFDEDGIVISRFVTVQLKRAYTQALAQTLTNEYTAEYFFSKSWLTETPIRPLPTISKKGTWLIFADRSGYSRQLAHYLTQQDQRCILINAGTTYSRIATQEWQIRPDASTDIQKLLIDIFGAGIAECAGILHMWSMDIVPIGADETHWEHFQASGCESVILLLQSLTTVSWQTMPRLWLVTNGTQAVVEGDAETLALSQVPLWGLGRVIANEYPQLRCAQIDLCKEPMPADIEVLVTELLLNRSEDEIAIRNATSFVARLNHDTAPLASHISQQHVQERGTYLITGGLGSLGLEIARWLIQQGARHLVLLGRSAPTPATQQVLATLQSNDVQIEIFQADVTQYDQLKEVFEAIKQRMPVLRGIVHAAGILDDSILAQIEPSRIYRVMAPKVVGAWNIHLLTQEEGLDFFLLFSSVSALLGTSAQGGYAAGNAFLDGLAHFRRAHNLPATAINWGAWKQVGLAAEDDKRGKRLAQRGLYGLESAEALQALTQVLTRDSIQVGIMHFSAERWRQYYPAPLSLLATLVQKQQSSPPLLEQLQNLERASQRRQLLEVYLQEQIAHILHISPEQIDLQTPLGELRIDSLMALEITNHLKNILNLKLSQTTLWNYPTVERLTDLIAEKMGVSLREDVEKPIDNEQQQSKQVDREQSASIEAMLAEIQELSDDDIYCQFGESVKEGGLNE